MIAFLFCCDYFDHSKPDPIYVEEYEQVIAHGFDVHLFDFDSFRHSGTINLSTTPILTMLIYRGWMLTVQQYEHLFTALSARGFSLINSPDQYRNAHCLPQWYPLLESETALSMWSDGIPDDKQLTLLLDQFGGHTPLLVKDWVKSRKHEWLEACYIPDSSDREQALGVIRTFIDRQDTELVGGVVLREYLPLMMIGSHQTSGMPLAVEVRVFCFWHQPLVQVSYWSGCECQDEADYHHLVEACQCIDSNFFTVDLAQKKDGNYVIIEIGDGQVSGLQGLDPSIFYDALSKQAGNSGSLDANPPHPW